MAGALRGIYNQATLAFCYEPLNHNWHRTEGPHIPELPQQFFNRILPLTRYAWSVAFDKMCQFSERLGNVMLWHLTNLPHNIVYILTDPRFVITAGTAAAMLAAQYAFYPILTAMAIRQIVAKILPYITPEIIRFSACILTHYTLTGFWFRAMARIHNYERNA